MINQIELSEQFDKIFTSQEVDEFYQKWKEENKKPSTLKDKLIIAVFIFCIVILLGGGVFFYAWYSERGYVEQGVTSDFNKYDTDPCFYTYVWRNDNIIKSTFTPLDKVTDSLKKAQYDYGEALLKTLNK